MMKFKTVILCLKLRKYYKIIAIDLSKQQALDADPELIKKQFYWISRARRKHKNIFYY